MARSELSGSALIWALLAPVAVLACGTEYEEGGDSRNFSGEGPTGAGGSLGSGGTGSGVSAGSGGLPPEQEIESAYRAPVVTGRYVWSANPESGRIAVIDPETLVVRLAYAGFRPTELAALPEDESADRAIVLNSGSADATILRADAEQVAVVESVPVHAEANAWAISPSGRWAVAWTDALRVEHPDPTLGFQDLTVVDLSVGEERAFELSVGYRPSRISFDAEEERAFVVTEPGISVVELGGSPEVTALIELTDDPVADPGSRDVSITPDGAFAFVRVEGSSALGRVDLASGARASFDLGAPVTDVDLAADATELFAVAGGRLLVVPASFEGEAIAAADFASQGLRSVSLDGEASFAALYATALPNPLVGIALAQEGAWAGAATRVVDVKAPVSSALIAPGGAHAVVLGRTPAGSAKAGAFALVPAQLDRAVKVVGTDAPPVAVTFGASGERALLSTRDDATGRYGAYVLDLTNLAETFVPLARPPSSIGVIEAMDRAFVAELHPEGRITFVDFAGGEVHTLTGFELAAKVEQ